VYRHDFRVVYAKKCCADVLPSENSIKKENENFSYARKNGTVLGNGKNRLINNALQYAVFTKLSLRKKVISQFL